MKIRPFIALFSLFLGAEAFAAPDAPTSPPKIPTLTKAEPQDDSSEPPAQYALLINGKAWPMILGKEISLDRRAGRTRFEIQRGPLRHFEKSGVSFDYPAEYGFEADLSDPKVAIWTLQGRSALLMLQRFPLAGPALLRGRIVSSLTARYGARSVRKTPAMLLFGGREIEGQRLVISFAKQNLVQEIFAFSTPKSAFVLVLQDTPKVNRETPETRDLKALLSSSSRF